MEMTALSMSRTRDLLASAALIAIVAAPLVPEPAAGEGVLAMHDMVPAQMQSPTPNVQQGPMGGMMEGEHAGTSGQTQQHGRSGQAPMGGDTMQGGGQGGMSGTMQHGSPMGGASAADEHARMMDMMRQRGMQPGMSRGP